MMTKLDLAAAASAVCVSAWDRAVADRSNEEAQQAARSASIIATQTWRDAVLEEGLLIGAEFRLGTMSFPFELSMLPPAGYSADETGAKGWFAAKTSYPWAVWRSGRT